MPPFVSALPITLLLVGCVATLDGQIVATRGGLPGPAASASASPRTSSAPITSAPTTTASTTTASTTTASARLASARPTATTGTAGSPSAFPWPELFGPHSLTFDPPLIGDGGLTPTGSRPRAYGLALRLSTVDGIIAGKATWCPSDFCETGIVQGNQLGDVITLQIVSAGAGGKVLFAMKGRLRPDGSVAGEVGVPAEPRRRFALVRVPEAIPSAASPPP